MKLSEYIPKLEKIASGELLNKLKQTFADESLYQIRREFTEKVDPQGRAWPPTNQENPILVKTGDLRHSFRAVPTQQGVLLWSDEPYAAYQQYGTRKIAARPILPTQADGGLGPQWLEAFKKVFNKTLRDALK